MLGSFVLGICIYRTGWARNEKGEMSPTLSLGAYTGSQFWPRALASWRGWFTGSGFSLETLDSGQIHWDFHVGFAAGTVCAHPATSLVGPVAPEEAIPKNLIEVPFLNG